MKSAELQGLDKALTMYDVEQRAWIHEPLGIEVNVGHVLTHLSKDLVGKDFTDLEVVRDAIAPDSVQYALRLRRWTALDTVEISPTETVARWVELRARFGIPAPPQ